MKNNEIGSGEEAVAMLCFCGTLVVFIPIICFLLMMHYKVIWENEHRESKVESSESAGHR